jgi:cob(I)alamin adenosyltransferase
MSEEHAERMARKKAVVDAGIAAAQAQRGLLLVHTGTGKGKSSAAFGILARALGHGMSAAVIQFVKSRSDTGEEAFFRDQPNLRWHVMGDGFTWETQNRERDAESAAAAWETAKRYLADVSVGLVILDEMTYAFSYGWLDIDAVLATLRARPAMQHVVITGRSAPKSLLEAADTATDMRMLKHAYQAGVAAMPGIEW